MADPDPLIVERPSEAVTLLRLNRPQVRNALNLPLRKRLAEEVSNAVANPAVRAIVLTGNEQAFAAGADIGEMADAGPIDIMVRNVQQYYRVVAECPKPVIVAIEGFALGGGLELALCADVIVAADGARLGLPEVKIGILPGGGGTQRLSRLVGRSRAMLLLMTGRMFGAQEAFAMGVASELTPKGEALKRALEIAEEIAAMPPISVQQIKEIVNEGLNAPLDTALMLERKAYLLQYATADQKEGMRAFLDKRKPKFEAK
jgi:enoyl-CoA hydratase/carnithine racemase